MKTSRCILVPVDYSAASRAALLFAADLAVARKATLLVNHFVQIEIHTLGDYQVIKGDPLEQATERLQAHVAQILAATGRRRVPFEVEATWGSPVLRIVETAMDRKVELIVMGTDGSPEFEPFVLGSVASHTLRLAPCPVLTVRAPTDSAHPKLRTMARAVPADLPRERVASVMSTNLVVVQPGDDLETARIRMSENKIRHLPVVDAGRLVGILSDVDLPAHRGRFPETAVRSAMTHEPISVTRDTTVEVAAALMLERRVRALPVVEGQELVGILSATDVLEDYVRVSHARAS